MAGLLPWMAIQEGISRASTALTDNAAMVKKTVFPVETLVLSVVLAAVVNEVIAFAVYAVYVAWLGHLSVPWLLLVDARRCWSRSLMTFGIACFAATVTTFVRDVAHGVGIALTVVFYATPIVYPPSLIPASCRPWSSRSIRSRTWPMVPAGFHAARAAGAPLGPLSDGLFRRRGRARGGALRAGAAPFRGPDLREVESSTEKDGEESGSRTAFTGTAVASPPRKRRFCETSSLSARSRSRPSAAGCRAPLRRPPRPPVGAPRRRRRPRDCCPASTRTSSRRTRSTSSSGCPKTEYIRVDERHIRHPIVGPSVEFFKEDDKYYYVYTSTSAARGRRRSRRRSRAARRRRRHRRPGAAPDDADAGRPRALGLRGPHAGPRGRPAPARAGRRHGPASPGACGGRPSSSPT